MNIRSTRLLYLYYYLPGSQLTGCPENLFFLRLKILKFFLRHSWAFLWFVQCSSSGRRVEQFLQTNPIELILGRGTTFLQGSESIVRDAQRRQPVNRQKAQYWMCTRVEGQREGDGSGYRRRAWENFQDVVGLELISKSKGRKESKRPQDGPKL